MQKMITEEMLYLSVRELSELLRARRITSVALAEAYLDRLNRLGQRLGAIATITRDLALKEAREADREVRAGRWRGPLHGVPYGVKDLAATRGIPTTWGAEPYKDQVFDYDATVIRRLRAAGAVLVAKLAMVELAGGFGYNNADVAVRAEHDLVARLAVGEANALDSADQDNVRDLRERAGSSHGGRSGAFLDRLRDFRVDHHAFGLLRGVGSQAHLRPREPPRGDGIELDAR